jgi:hypothetical protein
MAVRDGEMSLFAAGRYLDRIDMASQPCRFIERLVVLERHLARDPAVS